MARTKETNMSPEQQEQMDKGGDLVSLNHPRMATELMPKSYSSLYDEVENPELRAIVTEKVAATTSL